MSARSDAMMETLEEITKVVEENGGTGMQSLGMSMNAMMAIDMYEKKLEEKLGNFIGLITAIESGNYTDENGVSLTTSLTFKSLKNRLTSEA